MTDQMTFPQKVFATALGSILGALVLGIVLPGLGIPLGAKYGAFAAIAVGGIAFWLTAVANPGKSTTN